MSWGCNTHEVDVDSKAWLDNINELLERENAKGYPRWGRQGDICPWCYEDLQKKLYQAYSTLGEVLDERDELRSHVATLEQGISELHGKIRQLEDNRAEQ